MHKVLPVVFLLAISTSMAWGQSSLSDYQRDLDYIQGLYPRPEASEHSQELLLYLTESLEDLNVKHEVLDFTESEDTHSFARTVVASIPGASQTQMIIAIPLDHASDRDQNNDGSIGPALGLELARRLTNLSAELTVTLVFLGGEGTAASVRFLDDFYSEAPAFVVYLDLRTLPETLIIRGGSNRTTAPRWLVQGLGEIFAGQSLSYRVDHIELQLFRMGLGGAPTAAAPYLNAGIPTVVLEGAYGPTAVDTEALIGALEQGARESIGEATDPAAFERWDRHYMQFGFAGGNLYIGEQEYTAALLVLIGLFIMYIRFFRRQVRQDLETTTRNFWFPPLLFVVGFTFLMSGTLVIRLVQLVRRNDQLWRTAPFLFLGLKAVITLCLITTADRLIPLVLRRRHAVLPDRLFASAALVVLLLDVFLAALFDMSLTIYLVVPLLLIFFYGLAKTGHLRLLIFALSPLPLLAAAVAMFLHPGAQFAKTVLVSGIPANLVLAAVLLPFLIILMDLSLASDTPRSFGIVVREIAPLTFGSLSVVLILTSLLYPPFSAEHPQHVEVTQIIDRPRQLNYIEIKSDAPLGTIDYWDGSTLKTIESRAREHILPGDDPGRLLRMDTSGSPILDRENVTLLIRPEGKPRRINLTLHADERYVLLDSNFPVKRESEGTDYRILVGDYPPNPLIVTVTLPRGRDFTLLVRLEYETPPFRFEVSGVHKKIATRLVVSDSLAFSTAGARL